MISFLFLFSCVFFSFLFFFLKSTKAKLKIFLSKNFTPKISPPKHKTQIWKTKSKTKRKTESKIKPKRGSNENQNQQFHKQKRRRKQSKNKTKNKTKTKINKNINQNKNFRYKDKKQKATKTKIKNKNKNENENENKHLKNENGWWPFWAAVGRGSFARIDSRDSRLCPEYRSQRLLGDYEKPVLEWAQQRRTIEVHCFDLETGNEVINYKP